MVAADEVAAGPAQNRDAQVARRLQDIRAKPVLVAQRGAFLVRATIDAAAEMLDEAAVDFAVDATDGLWFADYDNKVVVGPFPVS